MPYAHPVENGWVLLCIQLQGKSTQLFLRDIPFGEILNVFSWFYQLHIRLRAPLGMCRNEDGILGSYQVVWICVFSYYHQWLHSKYLENHSTHIHEVEGYILSEGARKDPFVLTDILNHTFSHHTCWGRPQKRNHTLFLIPDDFLAPPALQSSYIFYPDMNYHILGQTNLITSFSGFQISKPMREAAFYFIF